MSEVTVAPAESTPAETVQSAQEVLNSMNDQQRDEYLLTRKLPEQPKEADSAPATSPEGAEPAAKTAETAPASDPGKAAQDHGKKPENNAETRIKQLLAERKAAEARAEAAEARAKELEAGKKPDAPAEPSTAKPATTETEAEFDEEAWAKANPNASWDQMQKAAAKFYADTAAVKAVEKFKSEQEKATRQAQIDKVRQTQEEGWLKKTETFISAKNISDFNDVAQTAGKMIPPNSVMDLFIPESEHGAALVYHLGQNPDEIKRILALPTPYAQAKELFKLEQTFSAPPATTPVKRVTNAPDVPVEVGGQGTAPADELADALERKDFPEYHRIKNARALKK